ncbi:MAG: hypothetical protein IIY11_07495 [Clostridia bacterium]|nr:hypothetical protein [Clostridia bacterium]
MKRRNYYNSYRGRRSSRDKKLIVGSSIVILLSLAALAFFILPEYIIFTSEGFRFTFMEDKNPVQNEQVLTGEEEDLPVVIVDGEEQDQPDQSSENPVSPEEYPTPINKPPMLGVIDNIENLLSRSGYGKGLSKVALEQGCNTLCFEIKGADGVIKIPIVTSYSSQESQSTKANNIKAALEVIDGTDIELTALVSAFRDDIAPRSFSDYAVTTSGVTWLDSQNKCWINPYGDMASEYLCDIIRACAGCGFDNIIFDDLCFPLSGKLELMDLGSDDSEESRYAALESIYKAIRRTADEEGLTLSVMLEKNELSSAVSGQKMSDLTKYFHTIFIEGDPSEEMSNALSGTGCCFGSFKKGAFSVPSEEISLIAQYLQ